MIERDRCASRCAATPMWPSSRSRSAAVAPRRSQSHHQDWRQSENVVRILWRRFPADRLRRRFSPHLQPSLCLAGGRDHHPLSCYERIEAWDWSKTNIRAESQGPEKRNDSVQRHVINTLLTDREAYDVIFDDDSAGDIADVVSLRVTEGVVRSCFIIANIPALRRQALASRIFMRSADRRSNRRAGVTVPIACLPHVQTREITPRQRAHFAL